MLGVPIPQIVVVVMASLLLGANVALLVEFGARLASWWTFKIGAVMALLAYIILAMTYGSPTWWRVAIAGGACVLDAFAFVRVYFALASARRDAVKLVIYTPLGMDGDTKERS